MQKNIQTIIFLGITLFSIMTFGKELLDKTIVVVNKEPITHIELNQYMANAVDIKKVEDTTAMRKSLLDQLVMRKILIQHAKTRGIQIEDEVLNNTIQSIADSKGMSLDELKNSIEKQQSSYQDFRQNIRNELVITRIRQQEVDSNILVTEEEINNYLISNGYNIAKAEKQYRIGHILISVPLEANPFTKKTLREKASKILSDIKDGKSFNDMATQYSDSALATQGGDMGWENASSLPEFIYREIVQLEKGEISTLIENTSGFHIVKLIDIQEHERLEKEVQITKIRHILFSNQKDSVEKIAREVHKKILDGDITFEDAVAEFSDDKTSAVKNGELEWITSKKLNEAFKEDINSFPINKTSHLIQSDAGWHIIEILGRKKQNALDEQKTTAKRIIFQDKAESAFANWIRELRARAYVQYLE